MNISAHSLWFIILIGCFFGTSYAEPHSQPNQEIVIGLASKPDTFDPHHKRSSPSITLSHHIFETLFILDDKKGYISNLLAHHELKNDTTWHLTLKDNIVFHDGTRMTSKDVIYSLDRIKHMEDSEFKTFLKRIHSYKALNELTIEIITTEPHPLLSRDLTRLYLLRHNEKPLEHDDFYHPENMIGTGPYQVSDIIKRDVILRANKHYHLPSPEVKEVRLRFVESREHMLNAFKQGEIHLIEQLKPNEVRNIRKSNQADFINFPSHRLLHLQLDSSRKQSPFVTDANGRPLKNNPLRDAKVRKAISLAIDRDTLVEEILNGAGSPASQLVLPNIPGHSPVIEAPRFDLKQAQSLLHEAGFSKGFNLIIHGTNNRYTNDSLILERIAEMISKTGIKTQSISLPKRTYFENSSARNYSAMLYGISTGGSIKGMLTVMIHSKTKKRGFFNDGHYSNKKIDALIQRGSQDFNRARRTSVFRMATELAMHDTAIIPLYFQKNIWAIQRSANLEYWPKMRGYTLAQYLSIGKRTSE